MKQLITSLFGSDANKETQDLDVTMENPTSTTTDLAAGIVSPTKHKHSGWQLTLKYLNDIYDEDQLQVFSIKSEGVSDITDSNTARDHFKSLIAKMYEKLNAAPDDDSFVNFDDSLVIRKNQFVSLSLTTVES